MDREKIKNIVNLLFTVGVLKRLPRTGWIESGIEKPESVADHTMRTAILCMVLSDLEGLKTEKTIRMALLHDLAEAIIGDLTPEKKREIGLSYISEEKKAVEQVLSLLPWNLFKKYQALFDEFLQGESPEAKLVAQADKLEILIQAFEYEEKGADPEMLERFWHNEIDGELAPKLKDEIRIRLLELRYT